MTPTPESDAPSQPSALCVGCSHPPHASGSCARINGREMYAEPCECICDFEVRRYWTRAPDTAPDALRRALASAAPREPDANDAVVALDNQLRRWLMAMRRPPMQEQIEVLIRDTETVRRTFAHISGGTPSPSTRPAEPDLRRCGGCGEWIPLSEVDSLAGHVRVGRDRNGEMEPVHCGPVAELPGDSARFVKVRRPADEPMDGLSIICGDCGKLVGGEEAGDRVRFVKCAMCRLVESRRPSRWEPTAMSERLEALTHEWSRRAARKFHDAEMEPDEAGKRMLIHGAACYANCAFELADVLAARTQSTLGMVRLADGADSDTREDAP